MSADRDKFSRFAKSAGTTLTIADVAGRLRVSSRTIRRWVEAGQFPPPDLRVNRRVLRWRPATVDRFIAGGGR